MAEQITAISKTKLERQLIEFREDAKRAQERMVLAKLDGDLSENADYDSARDEYQKVSVRAAEIEKTLRNCEVVGESGGSIIDIGSLFKLYRYSDKMNDYEYLGIFSLDSTEDFLSFIIGTASPLGKAIKGNESGLFTIQTDFAESVTYKVEKQDSEMSKEFLKQLGEW